jgi:hypothetical protein
MKGKYSLKIMTDNKKYPIISIVTYITKDSIDLLSFNKIPKIKNPVQLKMNNANRNQVPPIISTGNGFHHSIAVLHNMFPKNAKNK